jgi:hypothetical protein
MVRSNWLVGNPSDLPDWLNEEAYRTKIQPALAKITVSVILLDRKGFVVWYCVESMNGKALNTAVGKTSKIC